MTQLSAPLARSFLIGEHPEYGVKDSVAIWEGSAVALVPSSTGAGYARQLTAGDIFVGFAVHNVAATSGDGGARVRVLAKGIVRLTISSVAVTDIGKPVFASDGNAFTLTQGTSVHIGRVIGVAGTNEAWVAFDATGAGAGLVAELTDSSGGTASDTLPAISASPTQTEVRNSIASLAAKVNALLRQAA